MILVGRLVTDPDLRFTPGDGKAICRFRIAVKRPYDKEKSDFISCSCWNKTAETIANYFTKGRQIAISGAIRTGSYDAKDGTKRYTTDVAVESFEFVGNKGNSSENTNNSDGGFGDDMTPVDGNDMPF